MSRLVRRDGITAGLLAAVVHGFFVLLLVAGVSWQMQDVQPVMADLWPSLPEPVRAEPAPLPQPALQPEVKPQPVPDDRAAEIALEKKQREEQAMRRQEAEDRQKRREDARQKLELEREAAEKEKKLAEERHDEALRRDEEALRRRLLEESLAAEKSQLEARAAAARRTAEVDRLVAQYQDLISAKIRSHTRLPENLAGNPLVEFRLSVLPTGEIAKITLIRSSGNAAFDQAVQRGIERSSPLPLPPDPLAAEKFRELTLKHTARE